MGTHAGRSSTLRRTLKRGGSAPSEDVRLEEPSAPYSRNADTPIFAGSPVLKGVYADIDESDAARYTQQLFYRHPHGEIWVGDAVLWLRSLSAESVDLIFADPPYNVRKAEWDTFDSQQHYVSWSLQWIEQAARVLKPHGTHVCGYSEILADLRLPASRFFQGCRWLVWHYKNKANLGKDWGARARASSIFARTSSSR